MVWFTGGRSLALTQPFSGPGEPSMMTLEPKLISACATVPSGPGYDARFTNPKARVSQSTAALGGAEDAAYQKSGADRPEWRTVCPYLLAFTSGRWYLVASCEPRAGIRIFRLDRVDAVEALEQGFAVLESFSAERYVFEGKAFYAEQPETLRVRYGPAIARWIAEREGRSL